MKGSKESLNVMAIGQGLFYFLTGVWPLLSRRSFEAVTGPKQDWWLVKTVGGLLAVAGGVMAAAGLKKRVTPETTALAIGSAAYLTAIDVNYVSKKRISPIYLLDAVVEVGLIAAWLVALRAEEK